MTSRSESDRPRLRVAFLGSGSAGNAAVVSWGATSVLVDCGLSARATRHRMRAIGLDADAVDAIVLTHEHLDHVRGLRMFVSRTPAPVHMTEGTSRAPWLGAEPSSIRTIRPGEPFHVGDIRMTAFCVSHDTVEPVGYSFAGPCGTRFGLLTDTGRLTRAATEALAGCDIIGIEANHDVRTLENGAYPRFLKRRILSDVGHLSNADAASALEALASDRLRAVVALHVSRFNNVPDLAVRTLAQRLARLGLGETRVTAAEQDRPCVVDISDESPPLQEESLR